MRFRQLNTGTVVDWVEKTMLVFTKMGNLQTARQNARWDDNTFGIIKNALDMKWGALVVTSPIL